MEIVYHICDLCKTKLPHDNKHYIEVYEKDLDNVFMSNAEGGTIQLELCEACMNQINLFICGLLKGE